MLNSFIWRYAVIYDEFLPDGWVFVQIEWCESENDMLRALWLGNSWGDILPTLIELIGEQTWKWDIWTVNWI